MITRKQSIEYFSLRMDELISCNYLLADKKISNVLKTVTASKLFFELISYTAENFSFAKYYQSLTKGEYFPTGNKKIFIAFGFSLFAEIDAKNEDLLTILSVYYSAESFDKSYKLFVENFLLPFKNLVVSVATEMIENVQYSEKKIIFSPVADEQPKQYKKMEVASKNENQQQPTKKYLTCYKDIQKILITEKSKIIHCKHIKDSEKSDLLVLLDRFKECLQLGNKESIKTSFISYKYAVLAFKKIDTEVDDIERILKFCGAI